MGEAKRDGKENGKRNDERLGHYKGNNSF
jgi:hypothetical protein